MAAKKKAPQKINPLVTRMRQIATEVLRDMTDGTAEELSADERGEVINACLEDHGDTLLYTFEAFLALTMRDLLEDAEEAAADGAADGEED